MEKVDTGYELVHRFDNVIDVETCDMIYDYVVTTYKTPAV